MSRRFPFELIGTLLEVIEKQQIHLFRLGYILKYT